MQVHANAKVGPAGRRELVRLVETGLSLKAAVAAFSVSPAAAHRWWHRWLGATEGERGWWAAWRIVPAGPGRARGCWPGWRAGGSARLVVALGGVRG